MSCEVGSPVVIKVAACNVRGCNTNVEKRS